MRMRVMKFIRAFLNPSNATIRSRLSLPLYWHLVLTISLLNQFLKPNIVLDAVHHMPLLQKSLREGVSELHRATSVW
jgi:hypothetical protein